ncbi:cell wall-binding repeat 2 family protein [Clostridium sporogenes]|uniref:Cell wall-binding repeat 2 family protein n=1 Tax=Clostridium sporogenes TaxID=1509 RepID=A0A7X5PAT3_CLOSG|nr:cell wall-binding repeat-containing protein [Clostridium sporogenes]AJD31608.1 cell wall binding repeat 2 family protein [Clostridium botulinum Prevot_594]MBY7015463.1 cell wall-binding repeat-containing protein [Clostridium sporogenes]NFH48738.1 cell wall-binding repeat 2 family protein [Clostridium sporogenes]NFQ17089.1 cell wall-binding repeat 2 family protein [Clostridium sporogenes]NFQ21339.1 cell wall-binding repeat 2 family protein [Clostridium sporogenes]
MKKTSKALASTAALCLVLSTSSVFAAENTAVAPERLSGANRVDTAVKIAEKSFNEAWKGQGNAILSAAADANLVDSLAVAPLSYQLKAPILLNDAKDSINADTLKALKANNVKTVYIATGEGVISNKAKAQLEKEGFKVERLGGKNRYETAKNILDTFKKNGGDTKNVALVSGNGLADALSVAPEAARKGMPILLTDGKDAVAANLAEVAKAADTVYAIGGNGIISDALVQQLKADRVSGHSRYETNAAVIKKFAGDKEFSKIYLGNGQDGHLVDSLTGSVLAAQSGSPIVLADKNLADATKDALKGKVSDQTGVVALGGEAVVSDNLVKEVTNIANESPEYVAAEKAVKAYEDAKITTAEEITAAKALKAPAVKAIEAVKDQAQKDALNARIAAKDKAIEEAEAKLGFKVESVNAINATQVEVKFNTAIDKNDIDGKVKIDGLTFTSAVLSEDGKVLTLTANAAIDVKNATVVVDPIKTKADANVKTEKYVGLFNYKDEVAPTIVSVEAKTNGTVATEMTVKVSEPVKTGALAKVDGSYVSIDFAGKDKATIKGVSLDAGKAHTLELINLEDLAGNKVVSTSANFNVSVDSVAPTATITAQGDKEILVTFNKSMDEDSVKAALANGSVKDEALANVTTDAVKVVPDTESKQFVISITEPNIFANKDSRIFTVVLPKTIKDKLGNEFVATTQKVTLTKDTVKPVATGYSVVKDSDGKVKAIEITFSEGLKAANDNAVAFGSVVDENGVLDTKTFVDFKSKAIVAGDKKVVFESAAAKEINGKYAISFGKDLVSDLAETENKSDAFNYTIDFGKTETETTFELEKTKLPSAVNNVITVTFQEAVKGGAVAGSATDLANYTLAGKPLPAGTTITLDETQKVATIKLPAESIEKDDKAAIFTVANIKNVAGIKTLKTYTGTVDVKDNVNPQLKSAKVVDNKTIILTYDEDMNELDKAKVGKEFEIKEGQEVKQLKDEELQASKVEGFKNQIKLTVSKTTGGNAEIPEALPTALTLDGGLTIGFEAGTGANLNGTKFVLGTIADGTTTTVTYDEATKTFTINGDFDNTTNSGMANVGEIQQALRSATGAPDAAKYITVTGTVTEFKSTPTEKEVSGGVTYVPGSAGTSEALDLTKDLTIKALVDDKKDGSTIDITDLAGNGQKASDKAITITVAK